MKSIHESEPFRRSRLRKVGLLGILFAVCLSHFRILDAQTTELVAKLPGEVVVNNTGQAAYTIPIEVPAGVAGLAPELALAYSSETRPGPLGVGWSINGLSSVSRVGSILAIDGQIRGVKHDDEDWFALDGQRLVHVGGAAHGQADAVYRPYIDDFTRVTAKGQVNGPEYFVAETKSGLTKTFGRYDSSGLVLSNRADSSRLAWALDRIEDSSGNEIDFEYSFDSATNEQLLIRIAYGGPAQVEVSFVYEIDPNARASFAFGAQIGATKRLADIVAKVSGQEVWRYVLEYETSPTSKLSRLVSVERSFPDGEEVLPTTFAYRDVIPMEDFDTVTHQSYPHSEPSVLPFRYHVNFPADATDLGVRTVDLNGDGMTDVVQSNGSAEEAYLSNGIDFDANSAYRIPTPIVSGSGTDQGVRFVDLDGDGLIDVVHRRAGSGGAWLNTGSGWQPANQYAPPHDIVDSNGKDRGLRFADLNGDGLTDILWYRWTSGGGQIGARLNNGNGWGTDVPAYHPVSPIVDDDGDDTGLRLVDLDGDGLVDMMWAKVDGSTVSSGARMNTGGGWDTANATNYVPPHPFVRDNEKDLGMQLIDANGDGLTDLLYAKAGDTPSAYLNTGKGWGGDALEYHSPILFATSDGYRYAVDISDVKGDGLVDVASAPPPMESGDVASSLNSNDGWQDPVLAPVPTSNGFHAPVLNADFDGDGTPDKSKFWAYTDVHPQGGTINIDWQTHSINNHSRRDLLETVTDGFGAATTLEYGPITDDTLYTRETDADDPTPTFPIVEFQGPMWVVRSVSKDDGLGGQYVTSYRYAGARTHVHGFGFLGFRIFESHDHRTGLTKAEILRQDHPFTGMKESARTYSPEGQLLSMAENFLPIVHGTPGDPDYVNEILTPVPGKTLFPHFKGSVEWKAEYDPAFDDTGMTEADLVAHLKANDYGHAVTANASAYVELAAGATHPVTGETLAEDTYYFESDGFDAHGNILRIFIDYGDGYTQETVNAYVNDSVDWHLGRLMNASVVSTAPDINGVLDPSKTITRSSSFTYDSNGLLWTETVEPGHPTLAVKTTYARDAQGRIVSTTVDPAAPADGPAITTETHSQLDSTGRFYTRTENALGHAENRTYDPVRGWVTSQAGPNGRTTYFQYDALGRTVREDRPDGTWTETGYEYDDSVTVDTFGDGRAFQSVYKVTTTGSEAPVSVTWYDRLGRAIRSASEHFDGRMVYQDTGYNALGQADCISENYFADASPQYWTKTTYDDLGRPSIATAPDDTKAKTIYNGRETTSIRNYQGTDNDNPSANNQETVTLLNAKGDKQTVTSYNQADQPLTIDYHYDGVGNLLETVTTSPSDGTRTISMSYDDRGNKAGMVDPDMGTWSYTYNALGQLVTQTDAESQVTKKVYDDLGRVTEEYYGWVSDTNYETKHAFYYDGTEEFQQIGKLHLEKTLENGTETFRRSHYYDDLGRSFLTLSKINPDPVNHNARWFYQQTDYDSYSRPVRLTHYWRPPSLDDGQHDHYLAWYSHSQETVYDDRSFVTEVKDANGQTWFSDPIYNEHGQLESYVTGGATTTATDYEAGTQLVERIRVDAIGGAASPILDQTFQFDALGNLTQRTKNSGTQLTENFTYDKINRVLTAAVSGGDTVTMAYDDFGNISSRSNSAGSSGLGHVGAYAYATGKNRVSSAGGRSFLYDDNGFITEMNTGGNQGVITWTAFNKPAELATNNSKRSLFGYDSANARVTQTRQEWNAGQGTWLDKTRKTYVGALFEQEQVWNETGTEWDISSTRIYISSPAGIVGSWVSDASQTAPIKTIFHRDHLGSVVAHTDLAVSPAEITREFSFDAWGLRRDATDWTGAYTATTADKTATDRGYTGHEMLDELGLVHMNGRIYDPLLGRMLSADPHIQSPTNLQNYNRYSYVTNNPLSMTDPSGFFFKKLFKKIAKFFKKFAVAIVTFSVAVLTGGASLFVAGFLAYGAQMSYNAGGVRGLLMFGLSTAVTIGIGIGFGGEGLNFFGGDFLHELARATAHGISQGGFAELQGGDFGSSFLSGFTGSIAGSMMAGTKFGRVTFGISETGLRNPDMIAQRTIAAAVVGGTTAEIGGGKFANGAATAAMVHLLSRELAGENANKSSNGRGVSGSGTTDDGMPLYILPEIQVEDSVLYGFQFVPSPYGFHQPGSPQLLDTGAKGFTLGVRGNFSAVMLDGTLSLVVDHAGGVALQWSEGLGYTGGVGANIGGTITNAYSYRVLEGSGNTSGVTVGSSVTASGEANYIWGSGYQGFDAGLGKAFEGKTYSPQYFRTRTRTLLGTD